MENCKNSHVDLRTELVDSGVGRHNEPTVDVVRATVAALLRVRSGCHCGDWKGPTYTKVRTATFLTRGLKIFDRNRGHKKSVVKNTLM
jgi:hypothetical protein